MPTTRKESPKTFKIPCSWEVYAYYEVEADSLEDAIDIVESGRIGYNGFALPKNGGYVEDSFQIDHDIVEEEKARRMELMSTIYKNMK